MRMEVQSWKCTGIAPISRRVHSHTSIVRVVKWVSVPWPTFENQAQALCVRTRRVSAAPSRRDRKTKVNIDQSGIVGEICVTNPGISTPRVFLLFRFFFSSLFFFFVNPDDRASKSIFMQTSEPPCREARPEIFTHWFTLVYTRRSVDVRIRTRTHVQAKLRPWLSRVAARDFTATEPLRNALIRATGAHARTFECLECARMSMKFVKQIAYTGVYVSLKRVPPRWHTV